jgi:hypothetical protein
MTADELAAFVVDVRAEVDAIVARLETVDPDRPAPAPSLRERLRALSARFHISDTPRSVIVTEEDDP